MPDIKIDAPAGTTADVTSLFLELAAAAAARTGLQAILIYADVFLTRSGLSEFISKVGASKVVLVAREGDSFAGCAEKGAAVISVPGIKLSRMGQIKMAVLVGFSRKVFKSGDRVLCLSGIAGSGVLDTIFFLEIGREFELLAAVGDETLPDVNPDVFERVLDIAISLATDGREARPVGTAFVIGDAENLRPYTEQMIFNPFRGYPETERNVLDPMMEETIREFSALDGAFVIRRDGVVESAGTFLKSTMLGEQLPRGLGARHQSAAAITATTRSIAITVSESNGTVTVFKGGKILMDFEPPRPDVSARPRRGTEQIVRAERRMVRKRRGTEPGQ